MNNELNATIVNMVASGTLNVEVNTDAVAADLTAARISTLPGRMYVSRINDSPTVMVFRSGAVTVAGATSEEEVTREAKWISNELHDLNERVIPDEVVASMAVKYVVVRGTFGESVDLNAVTLALGLGDTEYEPEQFPGVVYRMPDSAGTMLVFGSGNVIVTGVPDLDAAVTDLKRVRDALVDTSVLSP